MGHAMHMPAAQPALTDRQSDILRFIQNFHAAHGYSPSFREIGAAFKIKSPNGVMAHLKALERKGRIHRDHQLSRGLKLIQQPATHSAKLQCWGTVE